MRPRPFYYLTVCLLPLSLGVGTYRYLLGTEAAPAAALIGVLLSLGLLLIMVTVGQLLFWRKAPERGLCAITYEEAKVRARELLES